MLQPALSNSQMLSSSMWTSLLGPLLCHVQPVCECMAKCTAQHATGIVQAMLVPYVLQGNLCIRCAHLYPNDATGLLASTSTSNEYFASSAAAASGKYGSLSGHGSPPPRSTLANAFSQSSAAPVFVQTRPALSSASPAAQGHTF